MPNLYEAILAPTFPKFKQGTCVPICPAGLGLEAPGSELLWMELARSGVRPTSIMQKRKWNSARGIVKVRESGERKFRPGNITELSQSRFSFSSLGKIWQCLSLLKLRTMHLCESVGFSLFFVFSFVIKSNIAICMYIWKRLNEHLIFTWTKRKRKVLSRIENYYDPWKRNVEYCFFRNCS